MGLNLPGSTKHEVIEKMVDILVEAGVVVDRDRMVGDLLERERVMSTGIGGGIAVPHAQSPAATTLTMALARLPQSIDFDALDERPVRLLFMLVGPQDGSGFVKVLARISRLLFSGDLQRNLLQARTPEEAVACIRHEETRITG